MKKLLDAFLDLPAWQGILLIVGAAVVVTFIATVVAEIAFRRGWNGCRRHWEETEQARSAGQVSERI
jgi:hypothetical protein